MRDDKRGGQRPMRLIKEKFIKDLVYNRVYHALFLLPFVLGFALYYTKERFSICLLINLFHLPCPLCGMSRAFIQLSHLKVAEAISYNLLIVIYAPIFLFFGLLILVPAGIKDRIYNFMIKRLTLFNILFLIFILITFTYGIIRIFDVFYHFAEFRSVVPENTILKSFSR